MNVIAVSILLIICVCYSPASSINLHSCPNQLESYYPKCGATEENIGYDTRDSKYVSICPSISSGQYSPNCRCRYGGSYVASTNSCPDPKCPTKSVTNGSYPNCECTESNEEYNAYLNECVMKCPENSTGRFPDCKCNDKSEGFSKGNFETLSVCFLYIAKVIFFQFDLRRMVQMRQMPRVKSSRQCLPKL